jgi:hypothetical protein
MRRTRTDEQGRFRVRLPAGAETQISALDRLAMGPGSGAGPASLLPAREARGVRVELAPISPGHASDLVTRAGGAAPAPATGWRRPSAIDVRLVGYDGGGERLPRGGQLEITLHYQVLAPLPGWRLFTHLVGEHGFANLDHGAVGGSYPVSRWQTGETIRDRFFVRAPATLRPVRLPTGDGLLESRREPPPAHHPGPSGPTGGTA